MAAYEAQVKTRAERMERLAKPIAGESEPALPELGPDGAYA